MVGDEVGRSVRVTEDSVEGEDGGGCEGGGVGCEDGGRRCEELGLKGIFEKCFSSAALNSARNSSLYENWVNTESKLDVDEVDERRLSP